MNTFFLLSNSYHMMALLKNFIYIQTWYIILVILEFEEQRLGGQELKIIFLNIT